MVMRKRALVMVFALSLAGTVAGAQTHVFTFEGGLEGWTADFADYPVTDSLFYELAWGHAALPWPLNPADSALRISGNNHSDDLFMFIKRRITGLVPGRTYAVRISMDIASCYPTNAAGVGGPPGEGVTLKAGVMTQEPLKVIEGTDYRMNIDKSNQSQPGAAMDTIGHVGVADTTTVYTIIHRSNETHPAIVAADSTGGVWLCIGTDSGFEATTTLYFDRVTVVFSPATRVEDPHGVPAAHRLGQNYPNPFNPATMIPIELAGEEHVDLRVYDLTGREVAVLVNGVRSAGRTEVRFDASGLASGVYIYRLHAGRVHTARTMLMVR